METTALRDDLLFGAPAIAEYLGWPIRRVYHCASVGRLPIGHNGANLFARKSELERALSVTTAAASQAA